MSTIKPSSPCVQICELDPETKLCLGCGRNVQEIVAWGRMSEPERLDVMAQLPARVTAAQTKS